MSRFQPANEPKSDGAHRFYSATDLAGMFGVCRMTIYRALDDGEIPAIRIRGRWIVPARAVDELVSAAIAGRFLDGSPYVRQEASPTEGSSDSLPNVGDQSSPGANQAGAGSPITRQGARGDVSSGPSRGHAASRRPQVIGACITHGGAA